MFSRQMAFANGFKQHQLFCGDMVRLGLSGNAGIRMPNQEDSKACLFQPLDQLEGSNQQGFWRHEVKFERGC